MWQELLKLLKRSDLQEQALERCYEMLDLCQQMATASIESLRRRDDAAVDIDIYKTDKILNSFEREVRRKVLSHLMLGYRPDVGSGLTLVSIVIDLERIGDYSKNIHDLAVRHPRRLDGGPLEERLQEVERQTMENLDRTAQAFKAGDIEEARRLMEGYKEEISGQSEQLVTELVSGEVELPSADAAALALYARFLKRISAHSRNLISSLVNPFDRIGYGE